MLRNAIADGVRVHSVNIMVFDYYLSNNEPKLNMRDRGGKGREQHAPPARPAVPAAASRHPTLGDGSA